MPTLTPPANPLPTVAWRAKPDPKGALAVAGATYTLQPLAVLPIAPGSAIIVPGAAQPDAAAVQAVIDAAALVAAKATKLAALASALNLALTAVFNTAPIQAQITFSNLAGPTGSVTQLIEAGQLTVAEAALQGMLTDQLVPPGYSAFIDPAVAAIVAAQPNFAAVAAATTVAQVAAVTVPAPTA